MVGHAGRARGAHYHRRGRWSDSCRRCSDQRRAPNAASRGRSWLYSARPCHTPKGSGLIPSQLAQRLEGRNGRQHHQSMAPAAWRNHLDCPTRLPSARRGAPARLRRSMLVPSQRAYRPPPHSRPPCCTLRGSPNQASSSNSATRQSTLINRHALGACGYGKRVPNRR